MRCALSARRHRGFWSALVCVAVALGGCGPEDISLRAAEGPPDCPVPPEPDHEVDEVEQARWAELGWPEGPAFDKAAYADVEAYVARHADSYGGMWSEDNWHSQPRLVVAFAHDAEQHEEALRALVGERGRVRTVDVEWSYEDLWVVMKEIDALAWPIGGADLVTIGPAPPLNLVDVGVDRVTPELRAELGRRFPAGILCVAEAQVDWPLDEGGGSSDFVILDGD